MLLIMLLTGVLWFFKIGWYNIKLKRKKNITFSIFSIFFCTKIWWCTFVFAPIIQYSADFCYNYSCECLTVCFSYFFKLITSVFFLILWLKVVQSHWRKSIKKQLKILIQTQSDFDLDFYWTLPRWIFVFNLN